MATANVRINAGAVEDICRKWRVSAMSLFGSVLRDDFGDDSDIDVLVTFEPGTRYTFEDMDRMEHELAELFGRRVDLVERRLVERSENYIRRRAILDSAEPIYVARR